ERMDRAHDETALHRNAAAHAAVAALELLANDAVRDRPKPGAAVAAQRGAEQSELCQARNKLDRETLGSKAIRDDRRDLSVDEPANGLADQPLVIVEQRSDVVEIERIRWPHG